jgi:hypothetical protein
VLVLVQVQELVLLGILQWNYVHSSFCCVLVAEIYTETLGSIILGVLFHQFLSIKAASQYNAQ